MENTLYYNPNSYTPFPPPGPFPPQPGPFPPQPGPFPPLGPDQYYKGNPLDHWHGNPHGYGWFGQFPGGPIYPGWIPNYYSGRGMTRRLVWARDAEELTGDRYFNAWDNKRIGIHPIPRTNQEVITIYYKKKPKEVLYMDDEIDVKDKFMPILKYAICMKLAMSGSNPDIDMYNVFATQYNTLLMEARRDKDSDQPYYQHVKDNARPIDYFRRRPWRGVRW